MAKSRSPSKSRSRSPRRMGGDETVQHFINEINNEYEKVHREFEDNFWATKMHLKSASTDELTRTKNNWESFLGDPSRLKECRKHLENPNISGVQRKVLKIMERTFLCYITEDEEAKQLKEELTSLESQLQEHRNKLTLQYTDADSGVTKKGSSVLIRQAMQVANNEATRKSCYQAMRSIGPHVAERFLEIVRVRNKVARMLGYEDFYDFKVSCAEGFGKKRLFEMMDDLETKTRPIMLEARKRLVREKGEAALHPWNTSHMLGGDTTKAMDPYFPFEDAVDAWARTYAALNIHYKDSTMQLDLCDREGKYSNGFCHWPRVAWRKPNGDWVPAQTNFTSVATPNQVGSGRTALNTLLHEAGHAAHFANIDQPSPLFSQERAPTSVAYAENQSMFLDSYGDDAAWLSRYARSREGVVIPWKVIADRIKATHPYEVFALRAMLVVPYFEKALYELPEDELTVEALLALADKVEKEISGGLSGRPVLCVPHILADESSCYYHGYVLAEMSVHHTRKHFLDKYGSLVDNPKIGKDLTEVYWKPGNSEMFLDLVKKLTGKPLSADAWVEKLEEPAEDLLVREKEAYEEGISTGPQYKPGEEVDLGMRVRLVHGDEVIADSKDAGLGAACAKFKAWIRAKYFPSSPAKGPKSPRSRSKSPAKSPKKA